MYLFSLSRLPVSPAVFLLLARLVFIIRLYDLLHKRMTDDVCCGQFRKSDIVDL